MQRIALSFLVLVAGFSDVGASEPSPRQGTVSEVSRPQLHSSPDHSQAKNFVSSMQLSKETRHAGDNTDGSCVQCSLTHCGYHSNVPAAARLLVASEYGPAVRGGSTPSRVANYCNSRHIKAWNITGTGDGVTTGTVPWMRWACRTGRYASIGFTRQHFETLWGYDYQRDRWLIVNNQLPAQMRVEEYDDATFIQKHMESGPWIVVLQQPASENPELVEWWRE
jgi:hypothetical protein